jgi:CheY-like chemotaxis protein
MRVLVAEDEALIRMDLVEMLEEEGYAVVGEAADGGAAVAMATELRPDLVLLDVKMPVLDGLSAPSRSSPPASRRSSSSRRSASATSSSGLVRPG